MSISQGTRFGSHQFAEPIGSGGMGEGYRARDAHPGVTCAIPGTRRVEHVNDNFGAAFGRLPDAALRRRQEEFFDSVS
jgi:hypothetical protein